MGFRALKLVALVTVPLGACGAPASPEPPPPESLSFAGIDEESPREGALTETVQSAVRVPRDGRARNVADADKTLRKVTERLDDALYWPRTFLAGVRTVEPRRENDTWVWFRSLQRLGWETTMTAEDDAAGTTTFEVRVTGLRDGQLAYRNFLWLRGQRDGHRGAWTVYDRKRGAADLSLSWVTRTTRDRELVVTDVSGDAEHGNDQLTFCQEGSRATAVVRKGKNDEGTTITWDRDTGAGKIVPAKGAPACWDGIANGQFDIPCPAGEWPLH